MRFSKRPWLLALSAAVLAGPFASPSQAALELRLLPTDGFFVGAGNEQVGGSGPDVTSSATEADALSSASAVIRQGSATGTLDDTVDDVRTLEFTASAGSESAAYAETSGNPAGLTGSLISFQIVGTAGEVGPVALSVLSNFSYVEGTSFHSGSVFVAVDGTTILDEGLNTNTTDFRAFNGVYNVGQTFTFDQRVFAASDAGGPVVNLSTTLRVAQTTSAIPEPGSVALLATGFLPLAGTMARRRRRGAPLRKAG